MSNNFVISIKNCTLESDSKYEKPSFVGGKLLLGGDLSVLRPKYFKMFKPEIIAFFQAYRGSEFDITGELIAEKMEKGSYAGQYFEKIVINLIDVSPRTGNLAAIDIDTGDNDDEIPF